MNTIVFRKDNVINDAEYMLGYMKSDDIDMIHHRNHLGELIPNGEECTLFSVCKSLGITTLKNPPICWTINIPRDLIVPDIPAYFRTKSGRLSPEYFSLPWRLLTTDQQLEFLTKHYVPHVVSPYVDVAVMVPEFTKKGAVHMHLICTSDGVKDDIDLMNLQRTVAQTLAVRKIAGTSMTRLIALNYIHFCEKEPYTQWIDYMSKTRATMIAKNIPYYVLLSKFECTLQPEDVPNTIKTNSVTRKKNKLFFSK